MGIIIFIWKMAAVELSKLSKTEKDELCVSYAALMLHDDGVEITAEKLTKVIKESGNEVEPYWPMLFAKALKTHKIGDLLSNLGSAGGGGGAGPAAAATGDAGKADEAEAAEEKQESDADVEMGGLFGDDDDDY